MKITNHAIKRMQERGISFEDVNRVAKDGKRRKILRDGNQFVIKSNIGKYTVIMSENGDIITTYKDISTPRKSEVKKSHFANLKYKRRIFELKEKDYEDELV